MNDNPWHRLPKQKPFVLPEDAAAVRRFNDGVSDEHKLRIDELLPEPFVGDPDAPVVFLGNNPGFNPDRFHFKQEPRFHAKMRANLLHEPSEWPLLFFDPGHRKDLGAWWERKLKGLLHYFDHAVLARSIFAVEHFPYPSTKYRGWRGGLPSKAQDYSFGLVRRAIERKAVVVLMRGKRRWFNAVEGLVKYKSLCMLRNPMAETISQKNCDRFDDITAAIEKGRK